jgi:transglutaminase-like putative cysteine protease
MEFMGCKYSLLLGLCIVFLFLCACTPNASLSTADLPLRDNTPQVLTPSADGLVVYENEYACLDASHTADGYVMVQYRGDCSKVRVQILYIDSSDTYTYYIQSNDTWQVFPLTCGSGEYTVRVLENIEGDSYAVSLTENITVSLTDELSPFLYPNCYSWFTADDPVVSLGQTLAQGAHSDLEVVESIYNYVIETITYDTAKAETLQYGYIPDIDETLSSGSGICFDYAALMTALLRSQGIPTRLETGYSDQVYHAWISTYVDDIGWIDNVIAFDGSDWHLLDPTLAANNDPTQVSQYIGDSSHYLVKYIY